MLVYVITFLLSLGLLKFSNDIKNNKIAKLVFTTIAILLPCFIAAFRDLSIGTDVNVYIYPLFESALRFSNFGSYLDRVTIVNDVLYLFITFISAQISSKTVLLFFLLELLTVVPLFIALKRKYKKNECLVFGMFLFFMFFFNQSLNMARQSIAISFYILAISYLDDGKDLKYLIFSIIAYLFHSSAIVFVPIYILFKYLKKRKNTKFIKIVIAIIMISLVFILPNVFKVANNIGIITDAKYYAYTGNYLRESTDFSFVNTFIYTFVFLLLYKNKNKISTFFNNTDFYIYISLLSLIILQFGAVIAFADRIGYFIFYPLLMLVFPSLIHKNNNKMTKKDFYFRMILVLVFIAYWFYWNILLQYNATYPYISIFN